MKTREELESIRAKNRAALGMSGFEPQRAIGPYTGSMVSAVPGMGAFDPLALAGTVKVGAAFPSFEFQYDPSQPGAPSSGHSSAAADWINRHVIRPYVEVGPGIRWAPGDGQQDLSGIALVLAGLAAAFGVGVAGWILFRAFAPRSA